MSSSPPPLRVFLADDSSAIRQRLQALLGAAHMDIVGEGESPQGCIAGILASQPDAVVLDVHLDGGTGLEVLRAVRSAAPKVAFVVLSTNALPAYRTRYLGEGASSFLDKSTEFDQLTRALARACHRPQT